MTQSNMRKFMDKIWSEVIHIRDEGQKEYAHTDENVFANFERTGKLLGVDREKILMTFLLKHIDGIAAYANGHKSQREDITGRLTDAIVYLCLLWAMVEEGREDNE